MVEPSEGTEPAASSEVAGPKKLPRWRRILVGFLVVVICLLVPISVVGVWVRNTILHTDQFVDTLGPLADDPAIQEAIANRVTTTLVTAADLETRLKNALPDRAKVAAPFIVGGAEQVVRDATLKIVESDQFQTLWDQLLKRAHTQVVAVLQGKGTDSVETKNGQVVVRLGPVVERVAQALSNAGISFFDDIDATRVNREVVLFDSEGLRKGQGAVDLLDKVANYLPFVALILLAIAIWLSGNRRRTILRTALGIAFGMALLLTLFNLGRTIYLDSLPSTVRQDAASAVYDQALSFLRIAVRTAFVLAIIVAIAAWLSGPGRVATRVRGVVRREPTGDDVTPVGSFVGHYRTGLRILVVAIGLIILVVLNHPKPLAVLVITVLVVLGLVVIEILGRHAPAEAASP
jgi:hypothetical protein